MAVYRSCFAEQTHTMEVLVGTASAKQNKVLASGTDKDPRHQTTSACCISWPNNRWWSVVQAIFGLARDVIQKNAFSWVLGPHF